MAYRSLLYYARLFCKKKKETEDTMCDYIIVNIGSIICSIATLDVLFACKHTNTTKKMIFCGRLGFNCK